MIDFDSGSLKNLLIAEAVKKRIKRKTIPAVILKINCGIIGLSTVFLPYERIAKTAIDKRFRNSNENGYHAD